MALRRQAEDRMRQVLRTFRYREVQTPAFEELELFLAKSGPSIRDELYDFKDKSGRELCLRPELTAPVMRFYFSEMTREPKPLRLFYIGPCYRYDRPQAGRYREFWQVGVEVIGDESPESHAELLWLALNLFRAAGLETLVFRVGHLGILRSVLADVGGIPLDQQAPLMRLIDKRELPELEAAVRARGGAWDRLAPFFHAQTFEDLEALTMPGPAQEGVGHLRALFKTLAGFGADLSKVRLDPMIARGLEYYTGLVFELDCPDLGAEKQLLGGGAYDLSGLFGAQPVATVGFALGFDRTLVALERTARLPPIEERVDALVAALADGARPAAQALANRLRNEGQVVELDLSGRPPKKALARADQIKARQAYLVGDRELARGVVTVKDLDTGDQQERPLHT